MKRSIFFIMILIFLFLSACSEIDSSSDTTQDGVYIKYQQKEGNDIDFQIVDENSYDINDEPFPYDKAEGDNFKIYTIYCDKDMNIIPVAVFAKKTLSVIKEGLKASVFSPSIQKKLRPFGLYCIFADDTTINSISIENGIAKVDFNKAFYQKKNIGFYLKAITYFLSTFYDIDKVYFLADNNYYSQRVFTKKEDNQSIIYVPQKIESNLFIIPKWIKIEYKNNEEYTTKSFSELVKSISYRFSVLNGLKLNSVKFDDHTLHIDLTEQLMNLKASSQIDAVIKSFSFTAKELDKNIRYVKITVNNKSPHLGEYDLSTIDIGKYELNQIGIKI